MTEIIFKDLGLLDYENALKVQIDHFELIKNIKIENRNSEWQKPTPNFFFFVTHPHTYTLGKNGDYANVLLDENSLEKKQISFFL